MRQTYAGSGESVVIGGQEVPLEKISTVRVGGQWYHLGEWELRRVEGGYLSLSSEHASFSRHIRLDAITVVDVDT